MKLAERQERRWFTGRICALALISGLLISTSSRAGEEAVVSPEQFLPANTVFYLKVGQWSTWADGINQTGLYKILQEPEVRAFLAGPLARLRKAAEAEGGEAKEGDQGNNQRTLSHAVPGPILIAVCERPPEGGKKRPPDLAIVVGTREIDKYFFRTLTALTQAFLPKSLANWVKHQVMYIKEEGTDTVAYQNADLSILPIGPVKLTFTTTRDHLVFTTDTELCKRIIDGMSGTLPKKLADTAGYKACQLSGAEHVSAYLDLSALRRLVGWEAKDAGAALEDLKAVVWSVRMDGPAFESRTGFILEKGRKGMLGSLANEPISLAALKNCPASCPFVAGIRVKGPELLGMLKKVSLTGGGKKSEIRWEAMEKKWAADGRDLKKEFADAFAGDLVVTSDAGMAGAAPGALLSQLVVMSLKDKAKAEKLLTDLMKDAVKRRYPKAAAGDVLKSLDFEGQKILYLRKPDGSRGLEPKYAFTESGLIVAMDMQTIKRVLHERKTKNLTDSEHFKDALTRSGGNMGSVVIFVDWAQMYASAFNMGAKAMKLLGAMEVLNKLGIDINMLPSPQAVTKHLFPSLAVVKTSPNGIVLTSRSPLPSAEVLAPPISAVVSAVAAFTSGSTEEEGAPAEKK